MILLLGNTFLRPVNGINTSSQFKSNIVNETNTIGGNRIGLIMGNLNQINHKKADKEDIANQNQNIECRIENKINIETKENQLLGFLSYGIKNNPILNKQNVNDNLVNNKSSQPIQLNHNIQNQILNNLSKKEPEKIIYNSNKNSDIKNENELKPQKTKEEIEEEKRLKREKMKKKMGNSTDKIIKANAEKAGEIEKGNNEKKEPNNVKNIAGMLANKIILGSAVKDQFNNVNNNKENRLNRLYQGHNDIQFEKEEKVIDDDKNDDMNKMKNNIEKNLQRNLIASKNLHNNHLSGKKDEMNNMYHNFSRINLDKEDANKMNTKIKLNDSHDLEDNFMILIENKPRLMSQVKKFKKPEFRLENLEN